MRRPWWLMLVLTGLVMAAGGASSDQDTLDRNRRRLDKLKADDDDAYARLIRDLRAFFALPPDRQRQIRDLDAKLHAGDLTRQARLWGVLERYGTWLDGLPEADRRKVLDAPTADDRLELIRFLRDREWAERAAPAVRLELSKLPAEKRRARIEELRAEERQQRRAWDKSLPPPRNAPRPVSFNDLPAEVQMFVLDDLLPALPEDRFAALGAAEGRWPDYPQAILELTRTYLTYRPLASGPVRNPRELPAEARKLMTTEKGKFKGLNQKQGWPDFALAFEKACRDAKLKCPELGACRLVHYPPATQAWVKLHLAEHAAELEQLEGQWPHFPDRVMELAKAKGLAVPGMMLPGPAVLWEAALVVK